MRRSAMTFMKQTCSYNHFVVMECLFCMNEFLYLLMENELQGGGWGGWRAYNVQDWQNHRLQVVFVHILVDVCEVGLLDFYVFSQPTSLLTVPYWLYPSAVSSWIQPYVKIWMILQVQDGVGLFTFNWQFKYQHMQLVSHVNVEHILIKFIESIM